MIKSKKYDIIVGRWTGNLKPNGEKEIDFATRIQSNNLFYMYARIAKFIPDDNQVVIIYDNHDNFTLFDTDDKQEDVEVI